MLIDCHPDAASGAVPEATLKLLRSIAARADSDCIAALRPDELAFAMTLQGRHLLERIRLDGREFRLSIQARALLGRLPPTPVPGTRG